MTGAPAVPASRAAWPRYGSDELAEVSGAERPRPGVEQLHHLSAGLHLRHQKSSDDVRQPAQQPVRPGRVLHQQALGQAE